MGGLKDLYKDADWKTEKHVPVIEAADSVKSGETVKVAVTVGKEVAHPNKTEHHIRWIELYFCPEGAKFPYQIGRAEFTAHGESAEGPDKGGVYTAPAAVFNFKAEKAGVLVASSYCNIHGLWQSEKPMNVL